MDGEHRLETFPREGRRVVRWDTAVPASVEAARAEFQRLAAEGYVLFALVETPWSSVERRTEDFRPANGSFVARRAVPVQTREFQPEAARIVAVRPARGG